MNKILYIANNLNCQNPTTTILLSKILKKLGFKVVISSDKKNKIVRLLTMCLAVFKHKNASFILIDTYSTYNFYYAFFTSQIARLLSIKYIPILHGGNLPHRLDAKPFLSKLIFNNSYLNVSPSRYLEFEFGKRSFQTVYIPNPIDLKNYAFKKRRKIDPKILWVRAFDKIYNPKMAIDVISILKDKYPLIELCMVGPDKDGSFKKIKNLATKYGIVNQVKFTGYLKKKDWILLASHYNIFLNTSNFDNMPVSVIEAMALGLPVISTNVGGMPYLINNKKNGILVPKNNPKKMASAIINLIESPKKYEKIAINARALVTDFDFEIIKEKWLKILTK